MELQIEPEPTDEERRAIVAALGAGAVPPVYSSRWLAAGIDELRGDALAEETGGDPGVVEP